MQLQDKLIQGFRLSPQQKRLWQLQQDSLAYRVQGAILLEGNLESEVLKKALQQVIQKHEILRTNFRHPQGVKTPLQVIADTATFLWREVIMPVDELEIPSCPSLDKGGAGGGGIKSAAKLGEDAQQLAIAAILQEERLKPFDFQQGSLVRAALLILSARKHILLLTLPALCADTRSLDNLVQEISRTYAACLQGADLDDDVVQYIQFSEWQNQLLEEDSAGKEFWQQQDFSGLARLTLPFAARQSAYVPFAVNSVEWRLEADAIAQLNSLAQQYNVTLSTLLLTSWQVLLWRLTGEPNIVIGVACDGRQYEELETAIGLFAKYLPLGVSLQADYRFSELLQQVEEVTRESQWQEYFTWEALAELDLLPFCFEFTQPAPYVVADLSISLLQQYACIDQFQVKLTCTRTTDDLVAAFDYDPSRYSVEDIQRIARYFQTLVASAIAAPKTPISQLAILNECDRHQLLVNNTQIAYPPTKCIHQLFEEQVERTPNNVAVVVEEQHLTYAQLNARANQLAHYLQQLGVKSEVVVGIWMDRSLDMLVGLLGILKAGGAYLPLDPALPAASVALRLQDAQAAILLTQQQLAELLDHPVQSICLDNWEEIAQQSAGNPFNKVTTENLAYVIYTSGSTGTPKGVAIEHQQLLNYVQGIRTSLELPTGASFALVSTLAADLGNTAIFPALCKGGCLHIFSSERATDPEAMADYCRRHPIDCLKIVPSHLKALLTASDPAAILPRQRLILGGEALNWDLVAQIQQLVPECLIFNHYGPTEATVGVLTYQVQPGKVDVAETVPLGRAIANTQVYVLDEHLQIQPIGAKGELYIGGAGLARGYLNQPQQTHEKFIRNPFKPDSRLYKTGDLARYLPDGTIEFLGRIDEQVKIRGYRIEPGEIAATLSQHPTVRQAVVLVREDQPGDHRLVGYVVLYPAQTPSISELRQFLKQRLPEYMIPTVVILKSLPLTANGKVDWRLLPAPDHTRPQLAATFIAPRTPLEVDLATIWKNLLNLEQIGIHDNFFDLGGHSLLLTQLLAKVRDTFCVDLPLRSLFAVPTIAGLAQSIEALKTAEEHILNTTLDLNAEAVLDPAIQPSTLQKYTRQPTSILLTGATGFLGSFLLFELLQQTQADIYCLVRAKDIESGKQKLQDALESYSLWDAGLSNRLIPVIGELSQPLLGLGEQQFQQLATSIDVIYHNGAFVNFTLPYAALKAANVLGTQEVLRLASSIKLKPVHFISSTSVAVPADTSNLQVIREEDCPAANQVMEGGYPQTKWVAEKLVTIAGDRGLPINIYRPGRISWHSQTGICNPEDHTSRMIAGCIQLGIAPDFDALVNLAPVDYVSRAIVYLSKQQLLGKTFHIVNPQPAHWHQFISWVRSFGYSIDQVSEVQWQEKLLEVAKGSPDHALYPLVPLLIKQVSEPFSDSILQFDCQNTLKGLAGSAINCPPLDTNLLTPYFSYLMRQGFLNSPHSN